MFSNITVQHGMSRLNKRLSYMDLVLCILVISEQFILQRVDYQTVISRQSSSSSHLGLSALSLFQLPKYHFLSIESVNCENHGGNIAECY